MIDDIVRYESGEMDHEQIVEFFQRLVETGMIFCLQGSYQRTAMSLINEGLILPRE